jgi:hypothetical protein
MAAWEERSAEEPELFLCECLVAGCREKVSLTRDEYEAVRTEARRFFVAPGHEDETLETVVDRHDGYVVIEKPPDLEPVVNATDPRSPEAGGPDADAARDLADELGRGDA